MVVRAGSKREHEIMEPHFSGPDMAVSYHERTVSGFAWQCDDCGLVWEKKWYAETCARRGHTIAFPQRYGGIVENGVWKGGREYIRRAIKRV